MSRILDPEFKYVPSAAQSVTVRVQADYRSRAKGAQEAQAARNRYPPEGG